MNKTEITELVNEIGGKIIIPRSYLPDWNPIEEFIQYVAPKEICHSRILAQFLDPKGKHGDGSIYLSRFLVVNGIQDFSYGTPGIADAIITTERSIASGRKIDIFIEWTEPTGQKRAVIIENKLNGAIYQPNQLEDYRDAIEKEGYVDVKVIALHINEKPQDSLIKADSIIYASDIAIHIFDYLLGKEEVPNDYMHYGAILPYENYLLSLSLNNSTMDTAKQILDLDYTTLTHLATLVRAFSKLNEAKNQWLIEQVKQDFPDICFETGSLEGDEQISFWRKEDIARNGCWVCVHYPKLPENDEQGTDVWLAAYPDNKEQADEISARLGFAFSSESENCWFCNRNGVDRFTFFDKRQELLNKIKEVLKVLSE